MAPLGGRKTEAGPEDGMIERNPTRTNEAATATTATTTALEASTRSVAIGPLRRPARKRSGEVHTPSCPLLPPCASLEHGRSVARAIERVGGIRRVQRACVGT